MGLPWRVNVRSLSLPHSFSRRPPVSDPLDATAIRCDSGYKPLVMALLAVPASLFDERITSGLEEESAVKTFWKVYFFLALVYKLWASVSAYSRGFSGFVLAVDVVYVGIFVALFGLAFQKKIATRRVWKYAFAVFLVFYLYDWIATPLLLLGRAGVALGSVARIQAQSLPLLPLIIAAYRYAWRSDALWTGDAPELPKPQKAPRWPAARKSFYLAALTWLVLLPVFGTNSEHFGWGFFPLIASIVVVPLVTLALLADLIYSTLTAFHAPRPGTAHPWLVPAAGALLLAGYAVAVFVMFT
jgi:hypothetical protein